MSKGKVLVVCSNATRIEVKGGGTGATGHYLNETVVPMLAVIAAGYEVVLATPERHQAAHRRRVARGGAFRRRCGRLSGGPRTSSPTIPR